MQKLLEKALGLQENLVQWRRHIHKNPEIGMDTVKTAAFIKAELEKMGYQPQYMAGTGVVAIAGGKKPGKCFLIRGDIDALPVKEEADVPYKSENGNMHACGHDFHAAMLLGAAKLLKEVEDEIPGCVKLMFQPAEENLMGAASMVEAGILEAPKVDAAAMFHVMTGMPMPTGTIAIPMPGPSTAASDWYEIHIKGKGGHGAMPQASVDPLNVMSHIHLALQEINAREVAPDAVVALVVGFMQGGTTSNVIPDTAEMRGTLRTYDKAVRDFVVERMGQISSGIAQSFRAQAELKTPISCPSVDNDEDVLNACVDSLSDVFGDGVIRLATKASGSEDFSHITSRVPGVMMVISAGSPEQGYTFPVHHPKVTFDEGVLCKGAAAYAVTALGWLQRNRA